MQLKKLEMCGFKSFANRTEIVFDRGVTGIVGPNGCGKSNVVDAIKWVLGTLSYKSVRGDEMLDVIFKGAEGVAEMGFAEVSLTLDNSDRTLPVEFEEVTITRRLFKDGQGEYYINRAPCRLRDIRDLLYGTGIGTDNYSIIEQGKIDKLMLSNPRERRLVFDEAAGVSKYRARKRETENRLEKVTQDLLRIQDMAAEVQRQLRSVRAQAGRAALLNRLQEEWKQKRLRLLIHEHRSLAARGGEISARLGALAAEEERLRGELEARNGALEEARRLLEAENGRHAGLAAGLASLESEQGYMERSEEQAARRCGELREEIRAVDEERAAQETRARDLSRRAEEEARLKAEVEAVAAARAAEADELAARLEDAARECARVSEELEARRSEAVELAHKGAQYRNELERLEREKAELEARAARLRQRRSALESELAGIKEKIARLGESRAAIQAEMADFTWRMQVEESELERLRAERGRLEDELVQLREGKDHRVARRETLRDLEMQLEGLESGARELLRERPDGVLGTVADLFEVAPGRVAAVEGALGQWAGAVVCGTEEQAGMAAEWIRARGLGRTAIVSLEGCRAGALPEDELAAGGILARADEWVSAGEPGIRVARALLGRTLVVQDASTAELIRREGLIDLPLVTPDGELFCGPGLRIAAGGRVAPGLISRKIELRRLEEEIERFMALITDRERRREEADRRSGVAEEKLKLIRTKIYELTVAAGDMAKESEQLSVREQFQSVELRSVSEEIDAADGQAACAAARAASMETLLAQLAWLQSQVDAEIRSLSETLSKYESGREEIRGGLERARMECVKAGEQRMAVEKRLEMLKASSAEAVEAVARLDARLSEAAARLEAAEFEAARIRRQREEMARRLEEARSGVAESAGRRGELAAACDAARAEAERVAKGLELCVEESGRLKTEEAVHREKHESLKRRAGEELGVDLASMDDQGPEEEGVDWEAASREVEDLRAKIAGFGAVNTAALEELKDLEERDKSMTAQLEDLRESKAQLEDLIAQLNKESRELFDKMVEFVREQFNAIFRKIFGGGKADIVVEQAEGVDPMDQGLEIMAKPPQKELTSISLLSGGERALAAIALVMALFKANPSPFCLLDEADAPLDEKNVDRFAGLIREFASGTQFIVITHNKRTMAVCDTLYGITMEQAGVSKRVKVNLSGDGNLDFLKAKAAPEAVPAAAGTPA